jgi:hypothetical protein
VLITRSNFNNNTGPGLRVITDGMLTVNHISASGNGSLGASLETTGVAHNLSILNTLGGNVFNDNLGTGLSAINDHNNNIIANGITANNNGGGGALLNNYMMGGPGGTGTVSISGGVFEFNRGFDGFSDYCGLGTYSSNAVSINNVRSFMNGTATLGGDGISVMTDNHNLTITNSAVIGNLYAGLNAVIGSGMFTITNTTYFGNNTGSGSLTGNLLVH